MSTGHWSEVTGGSTSRESPVPASASFVSAAASDTVEATGTAPGCQVTVARASSVTTAPARPCCAAADPVTAGGTGASATTAVVGALADCEPPFPVAVTTSDSVAPMSSGVSVYEDVVAFAIGAHAPPVASQRRHWYANEVGAPVHEPAKVVSVWPACVMPETLGATIADGLLAVPLPAGVTASVAGDDAPVVVGRRRGGHGEDERVPDVRSHGRVRLQRRAGNRHAARPGGVAALPLVRERDRLAAAPRARDAGEDGARPRGARNRRRRRHDRRSRRIARDRDRREVRPVQPVAVGCSG